MADIELILRLGCQQRPISPIPFRQSLRILNGFQQHHRAIRPLVHNALHLPEQRLVLAHPATSEEKQEQKPEKIFPLVHHHRPDLFNHDPPLNIPDRR